MYHVHNTVFNQVSRQSEVCAALENVQLADICSLHSVQPTQRAAYSLQT